MPRSGDERRAYLDGVTIAAGALQPRLEPGIAMAVLRDGPSARSARHREGIVHGDVEPSNIMLKRPATPRYLLRPFPVSTGAKATIPDQTGHRLQ